MNQLILHNNVLSTWKPLVKILDYTAVKFDIWTTVKFIQTSHFSDHEANERQNLCTGAPSSPFVNCLY